MEGGNRGAHEREGGPLIEGGIDGARELEGGPLIEGGIRGAHELEGGPLIECGNLKGGKLIADRGRGIGSGLMNDPPIICGGG